MCDVLIVKQVWIFIVFEKMGFCGVGCGKRIENGKWKIENDEWMMGYGIWDGKTSYRLLSLSKGSLCIFFVIFVVKLIYIKPSGLTLL